MTLEYRRTAVALIGALVWLACGLAAAGERNKLPLDFVLEPVVTGLDRPSAMAVASSGRVFVAERHTGEVHLVRYGKRVAAPVVAVGVAGGADEGLLDVAWTATSNGEYLFLFYVDAATGAKKVVRYDLIGATAANPWTVLDLGGSLGQTRPGGGIVVGRDGKLYVGIGDMEASADAQDDGSPHGKILRLELDGSIPADNPTPGSAVWAKGFRDVPGLAAHPSVDTVYATDRGPTGGYDELNAVAAGANHGWDVVNGTGGTPGYVDPLQDHPAPVGTVGVTAYVGNAYPDGNADGVDNDQDGTVDERDESYRDSLFYACYEENDIMRSSLSGGELTTQDSAERFFDPNQEWDLVLDDPANEIYHMCNPHVDPGCGGTVDPSCPANWSDLSQGPDGLLYGVADDAVGTSDGLYRFTYDTPGPREVSAEGSLVPLSIEKTGGDLVLNWEDLGRDAWVGSVRGASQPAERYTVWEGTLPIDGGTYDHQAIATTDGTAVADRVRSHTLTPGAGSTYYLVSAQGANLEGSLGEGDGGAPRPGKAITDYCDEIGWYDNERGDATKETQCNGIDDDGDGRVDESCPGTGCGAAWNSPRLLDQYGNYRTLHDFRGSVVHMEISALNCYYCQQQAPQFRDLYTEFKGRGFRTITVLMNTYGAADPIPPENCAAEIRNWIDTWAPGSDEPVLCGVDDDGNGLVDVYEEYSEFLYLYIIIWQRCNGTPMNFYFDQGMFMYEAFCGKTNVETTRNTILQKLPPAWCE